MHTENQENRQKVRPFCYRILEDILSSILVQIKVFFRPACLLFEVKRSVKQELPDWLAEVSVSVDPNPLLK